MSNERMILKPTNDASFKKVFGDKQVVKEFINDSFKEEVVHEILDIKLNSTRPAEKSDFKVCIADAVCKSKDGLLCIVEMQLNSNPGFMKRVVYYSAGEYVDMIRKGDEYSNLNSVYLICVCDFTIFPNCDYYSVHETIDTTKLRKEIGNTLTEDMIQSNFTIFKYVVLQLPKFDRSILPSSPDLGSIEFWMIYFRNANDLSEEEQGILCLKKPILKEAIESLRRINFDDEQFDEYEKCEKAIRVSNEMQKKMEAAFKERDEAKEEVMAAKVAKEAALETVRLANEKFERERIAKVSAEEKARLANAEVTKLREELRGLKRKHDPESLE